MDMETFALFVAMEVALLFAGALFMLYRKYLKLRKQLIDLPAPVAVPENFDSIESGYFSYLEKELLATQARLEQAENESDVDAIQVETLRTRLTLFAAEKHVVESTNDYPDRHWEFVLEHFRPVDEEPEPEQESDAVEPDTSDNQPDAASEESEETVETSGSSLQVEALQDNLNQQGIALDSMRQVLQQVKQDPQAELIDQLEQQLQKLERQYQEANTCIEIMGQENDRLQEKIDRRDHRIDRVEAEKTESVADLEEQLDKQKRSITDLHNVVVIYNWKPKRQRNCRRNSTSSNWPAVT